MPGDGPPIHQVQKTHYGTWEVAITWNDGGKEWHGAFKTDHEAREWALAQTHAWQDGRGARNG
jgi:hypothetical protein